MKCYNVIIINLKKNIYLFFLGILSSVIDYLGIKALIFMNAGVILLNIKKN